MSNQDWEQNTPTNAEAARRPYCTKHSRAMLDIGGKKQCTACMNERQQKEETEQAEDES